MDLPFVSIITPTYNRRKFIQYLIKMFKYQDYPQHKMELIIGDDGEDCIKDIIPNDINNIMYIRFDEKIELGRKMNILNEKAKGDIIICMDDDDYQFPTRVSSSVKAFIGNNIQLVGNSRMLIYFPNIDKVYETSQNRRYHATNGTMGYRKEYLKDHSYREDVNKSTERDFTGLYREPLIQLNSTDTIICIAHDTNTCDKKGFIEKFKNKKFHKLEEFVDDNKLLEFYKNLNL